MAKTKRARSEFLSAAGISFDIFRVITNAVLAEGGSDDDLRSLLSDEKKCKRVALEIMGRERITVPNLSAAELIKLALERLNLPNQSSCSPRLLAAWDFYKNQKGEVVDVGGKTYEVMVWAPGRAVTTDEARKHFPKGFMGNTAAFVAWVTAKNPEGSYTSIPEDEQLLLVHCCLQAMSYSYDDRLMLDGLVDIQASGHFCYVAFRLVQA